MGLQFWYQQQKNQDYIRLGYDKDGFCQMSVDVYPSMGFKTAGLCYQGDWLQPHNPNWESLLRIENFGNIVMFPTPNRVRDGKFTFRGRQVEMKKKGVSKGQHGLAQNSPWRVRNLMVTKKEALITAEFCIYPGDENYVAYPFASRLTMTYVLRENELACRYEVENLGEDSMPFGIGLHPWFLLPEKPERVSILVPARYCYETTEDLLPTGNMIEVKGKDSLDLNSFRPVRELDLDTVYLTEGRDMAVRYEDRGYQLMIHPSPEFMAGVVFTAFNRGMSKPGYEAFCVECQTCCTDAINMYEKGFPYSGLMILDPGKKQRGCVTHYINNE